MSCAHRPLNAKNHVLRKINLILMAVEPISVEARSGVRGFVGVEGLCPATGQAPAALIHSVLCFFTTPLFLPVGMGKDTWRHGINTYRMPTVCQPYSRH